MIANNCDYWAHLRSLPSNVLFGIGRTPEEIKEGKLEGRTCETIGTYKLVGHLQKCLEWTNSLWVGQRRRNSVEDDLKKLHFFIYDSSKVARDVIRVFTRTCRGDAKGPGPWFRPPGPLWKPRAVPWFRPAVR